MSYFVITTHEDRSYVNIEQMNDEQIWNFLNDDDGENLKTYQIQKDSNFDLEESPIKVWIIKGEIVVPKEKSVITEYTID